MTECSPDPTAWRPANGCLLQHGRAASFRHRPLHGDFSVSDTVVCIGDVVEWDDRLEPYARPKIRRGRVTMIEWTQDGTGGPYARAYVCPDAPQDGGGPVIQNGVGVAWCLVRHEVPDPEEARTC